MEIYEQKTFITKINYIRVVIKAQLQLHI